MRPAREGRENAEGLVLLVVRPNGFNEARP